MQPISTTLAQAVFKTICRTFCLILFIAASLFAQGQDVLMGLTSNGGPEGKGTAFSIKTDGKSFGIVKAFAHWGATPVSDLVQGTDGYFYGMAYEGGTHGYGTIFRITNAGVITILKHFNSTTDGAYPKGSLIQAKDGAFYGLTSSGGVNYGGTIFKITTAGTFTVLHSFAIGTQGGRPQGRLVQATDGAFYGITSTGGTGGYGTIFKFTTGGTYTVLKHLASADGTSSYSSLVQANNGNLYGMTHTGGAGNRGVIFRITTGGTYTVLHSFNGTNGQYPKGSLIQAKDGLLYGMTNSGGTAGNGTAFKIGLTGSSFTVLRNLSASVEGGSPSGSFIQATDGAFYALAYSFSGGFQGSVFKMTTSGTTSVVKKFTLATEGGYPAGSLIQAKDGLLYGMTNTGGKMGSGTIFKLTTSGTITLLSHLPGHETGNAPQEHLALGKDSAYFGVAYSGGATNTGTIFKICGGTTTLVRLLDRNKDGANPSGGLVRAKDGTLYGTAETGGTNGAGTIFKLSPTGTFTVLRHLKSSTDGSFPRSGLVFGPDSALYGITYSGGTSGSGTIYKITTSGTFTVLRHLNNSTDGGATETALTLGKDGIFYGLTGSNSRFFKITKEGVFTAIKTLNYSTDGGTPAGSLLQAKDGAFYVAMTSGGTYSGGIVLKITATGTITKLRSLSPTTDGSAPKARLVQAADGALYGTTSAGGTYSAGTIFKITTGGTYTVLRHLDLVKDGGTSLSGLTVAPKISLTATAQTSVSTSEDVSKSITLSGSGPSGFGYAVAVNPKNGTLSGSGAARTYKPNANYAGKDSFAFQTTYGCFASSQAWVVINVTSVNDAPVLATIGAKTVAAGSKLSFTATATDADAGQTKTFSLVSPPSGATISGTSGAFSWTPAKAGTYSVKVKVTDNGSPVLSDEETVTVTVTAAKAKTAFATVEQTSMIDKAAASSATTTQTTIYPNPVQSRFTVQLQVPAGEAIMHIIDAKGVVVKMDRYVLDGQSRIEGDATGLKAGWYLVRIETLKGAETVKMLKQ